MLFNSLEFAVFLIIVFAVFWVLPEKVRPFILMISSFYFYMRWKAVYLLLIIAIILISYLCSLGIERCREKDGSRKKQKLFVALNCIGCLGLLFYFKYFNFLSESVNAFMQRFNISGGALLIDIYFYYYLRRFCVFLSPACGRSYRTKHESAAADQKSSFIRL